MIVFKDDFCFGVGCYDGMVGCLVDEVDLFVEYIFLED